MAIWNKFSQFNEKILSGQSPQEAALATWAGQMAKEFGFTKVKVTEQTGTPGKYTSVMVILGKSPHLMKSKSEA